MTAVLSTMNGVRGVHSPRATVRAMSDAPIAIVDDARFDAHEDHSGHHPECPERLIAARSGLYSALTEDQRSQVPARAASTPELSRVHMADYVNSLDSRLARGMGNLDPDTYFGPGTREAAWNAAGGAIDLTRRLVQGQSKRGVALLRPPGHHAVPASSMGFCLLNNVALAASEALSAGFTRIAIVDWDVHHGNGTQDVFYQDPRVLFVSLHQFPFYPGTGATREIGSGAGLGFTANLALPSGSDDVVYGAAFREVVLPLLRAYVPEIVLVSAGFDAHARDPLASMQLSTACYGAMTSALLELADSLGHGRIAFFLEGGYDLQALEASMAQLGLSLKGAKRDLPEGRLRDVDRRAIEETKRALATCWQLPAASA
jgi:acetoin utilization deacetylase AcuC-like enzyme